MYQNCFHEYNKDVTNCKTPFKISNTNNFCDEVGWENELRSLQTNSTNPEKDHIYLIKDYGQSNACWKLFLPKQSIGMMGQNDTIPRLPYACIFDND